MGLVDLLEGVAVQAVLQPYRCGEGGEVQPDLRQHGVAAQEVCSSRSAGFFIPPVRAVALMPLASRRSLMCWVPSSLSV